MIARTPEPEELMDDAEQALAYAQADFSEANALFVDLLEKQTGGSLHGRLLDLGCGPADIPLTLITRHPQLHIDAVDGAQAMLELAARALDAQPDLKPRCSLHCLFLPTAKLQQRTYQAVVSNSLLHHLADPLSIWSTVRRCAAPGADVLIMDLARPASLDQLDRLVETYAHDAPMVLRTDFRNSLHAAYTVSEVQAQIAGAGLSGLEVAMVSDRHLAASGKLGVPT
jgi:SAM-dependent methyltransferase